MIDATERARRYVAACPPAVEGQGGHALLVRILYRLGDLGVAASDALALVRPWAERCTPPWRDAELRSQIESAWRTRRDPVGRDVGDSPRGNVVPLAPRKPTYPGLWSVLDLWRRCVQIPDDPDAVAWWTARGLPLQHVAIAGGIARVLPRGADCPDWATIGGHRWSDTSLRLLLMAWSPSLGECSLRARSLSPTPRVKEVSPLGYSTQGLCYLDDRAQDIVQAGAWRESIPLDDRIVCVVEGGPDYLAAWGHGRGRVHPWATIGVFAGSWTDAIARRIPRDSTVLVCTDTGAAGEEYARRILTTLDVRKKAQWRPI